VSRPIINVDLDGVIYPFTDVFAASNELHGRFGPNRATPSGVPLKIPALPVQFMGYDYQPVLGHTFSAPSTWNFWPEWGMTKGEWNTLFRRGVEYGMIWNEGIPYDGAVQFLWKLSEAEYHIRIVTKRLVHQFGHKYALKMTADWLDKNAVPYRSIAFLGDEEKYMYPAAALIDDNPEYVYDFVENVEGAIGFIPQKSWNRYYSYKPQTDNVFLVNDWDIMYDIIRSEIPIEEA